MKKIEGYSLIELIITIVIVAVILMLVGVTMNTMIRTSANASSRTTVREEGDFILEMIRKSIKSSHTEDINVYAVSGREYNENTEKVVRNGTVKGYGTPIADGARGTEVHFRPSGYSRWLCIGYFPSKQRDDVGYILRSSVSSMTNPADCFNSSKPAYAQNTLVLNSDSVAIEEFELNYFPTEGDNIIMTVNIGLTPTLWVPRFNDDSPPTVYKQAVVSTQKLTWE